VVGQARYESGEPLLTIAARRVGLRKAFKVLSFMAAWGLAEESVGRSIGIEEYASWWREANGTVYRHQALFREAFPGESTPARLLALASEQWDERKGITALGAVVVAL
jgi:hypothetical protein